MTALTKYDAARNALQVASSIDEVKDIRDKAEAMAAYARQARDTALVEWATEIKVRAERRAGQMLADMPKNEGAKGLGSNQHEVRSHDSTAPKTLAEIGISKNESSRWQKLAGVSDEKFESAVSAAKEVAGEVTTAAMLRIAKVENKGAPSSVESDSTGAGCNPIAPEEESDPGSVSPQAITFAQGAEVSQSPVSMKQEMMQDALEALREENESLRNKLSAMLFDGSDDEKAELLNRLNDLTEKNKQLEIVNESLVVARDRVMAENVNLRKQCEMNAKKLRKVA